MSPARVNQTLASCSGVDLHVFFRGGVAALERCATAVDKLNVFPVPDGDTGTNLMRTLADALHAVSAPPSPDVGVTAAAIADAVFRHARGNSGTIFAQLCAGLAQSLRGYTQADTRTWADAWAAAARVARRSVNAPVDGTMLTVADDAASAARVAAASDENLIAVWRAMADAADATVIRTPTMLAVLQQANVVDAGALGLALFFRGALAGMTGEAPPDPAALMQPTDATRRVIEHARFPRYCTQFLLRLADPGRAPPASQLATFGDSVDIAGAESDRSGSLLRIHLHADDPDAVVAYAHTFGDISGLKTEDMQRQRALLLASDTPVHERGMVAVARGEGMRRLFESLYGVTAVIAGTVELDAIATRVREGSENSNKELIVLANGEHVIDALERMAPSSDRTFFVVPTKNSAEGIAAALAFNPELSAEHNIAAMMDAVRAVTVVGVTRDEAATPVVSAMLAGRALAVGGDLVDVAARAVHALVGATGDETALVTLYQGAVVSRDHVDALVARLRREAPGIEVEIISGGQPECLLWIAVESDAGSNRH